MERIDHLTIHDYLEKLASPSFPGPASGSAAATVAAMAAALLEMSCRVTLQKGVETNPNSINIIEEIRRQCLDLATEDMMMLTEVIRAAKTKKELPDKYEMAMKNATDTLVSIVKNCEFILTQIEQLIPVCNKKVLGELMGSTYMAEAAATSAKLGVEANLPFLHDEYYKENVLAIICKNYRHCTEAKDRIIGKNGQVNC